MKTLIYDAGSIGQWLALRLHRAKITRLSRLFLAVCLLASLACDVGLDSLGLDTAPLTVVVMTVGGDLDADGYTLSITGMPDEAIGINDSTIFNVLRIDVTVELLGVAGNCTVNNNPQTVSVSGPTTVTFVVECS